MFLILVMGEGHHVTGGAAEDMVIGCLHYDDVFITTETQGPGMEGVLHFLN